MRVSFGPFTADAATRQLLRDGRAVHLSPKAFDLLQLLLERRPAVVQKSAIQERVWPGTFVEDASLSVLVAELRRALDDDPRTPAYIRTVHGRGYAFCGDAIAVDAPMQPPGSAGAEPRPCWIVWREQRRPLARGPNVLGRDPACEVWLDAPGVSRRHARIVVGDAGATIEDLSSTNGTFVGRSRLAAPRSLSDGDIVRLGPEPLTFRAWSGSGSAATERVRRGGSAARGPASKTKG